MKIVEQQSGRSKFILFPMSLPPAKLHNFEALQDARRIARLKDTEPESGNQLFDVNAPRILVLAGIPGMR